MRGDLLDLRLQLAAALLQDFDAALDFVDDHAQVGLGRRERRQHAAGLVQGRHLDVVVQVALCNPVEILDRLPQGAADGVKDEYGVRPGEYHAQERENPGGYGPPGQACGSGADAEQRHAGGEDRLAHFERHEMHDVGNEVPRFAIGAPLLAHVPVEALGGLHFLARRLGAHRHVAERLLLVAHLHHQRLHPIVVAVLAAVLDHPAPGPARLDGRPQVLEGLRRHVRMPDHVVALADQFLPGEPADLDEGVVGMGDHPFQIRPRDDDLSLGVAMLDVGHRKISFHDFASFAGQGFTFLFI